MPLINSAVLPSSQLSRETLAAHAVLQESVSKNADSTSTTRSTTHSKKGFVVLGHINVTAPQSRCITKHTIDLRSPAFIEGQKKLGGIKNKCKPFKTGSTDSDYGHLIRKSIPLDKECVFHRRIRDLGDDFRSVIRQIRPGNVISSATPMFMSESPLSARNYGSSSSGREKRKDISFHFYAPAGFHCAIVERDEGDVITRSDVAFLVRSVSKRPFGAYHVEAEFLLENASSLASEMNDLTDSETNKRYVNDDRSKVTG